MRSQVAICEVGPRDGLQNEPSELSPELRAKLIDRLAATRLQRIEGVSFVDSRRVPQMAGAEQVIEGIERWDGIAYSGLVLNERGYDRLAETRLREAHFAFAVTESFNRRNSNASVADGLAAAGRVISRARTDGRRTSVSLIVSFGCPFEGRVDPGRVLSLAERVVAAGADELVFADTVGVAVPRQVRELVSRGKELGVPVGFHGHNTRNTGFANAYAALEAGVDVLDSSAGGLGGCPFAPRATGNIATEDLLYLLQGEGVETGVDLDALLAVVDWLEGLIGRELPGQLHRAGAFPV